MSKTYWKDFNLDNINFNVADIKNKLVPVIKKDTIPDRSEKSIKAWTMSLLDEVRNKLKALLFPLTDDEQRFLDEIHEHGKVNPELICDDDIVMQRIKSHPNLMWRIYNKGG